MSYEVRVVRGQVPPSVTDDEISTELIKHDGDVIACILSICERHNAIQQDAPSPVVTKTPNQMRADLIREIMNEKDIHWSQRK